MIGRVSCRLLLDRVNVRPQLVARNPRRERRVVYGGRFDGENHLGRDLLVPVQPIPHVLRLDAESASESSLTANRLDRPLQRGFHGAQHKHSLTHCQRMFIPVLHKC